MNGNEYVCPRRMFQRILRGIFFLALIAPVGLIFIPGVASAQDNSPKTTLESPSDLSEVDWNEEVDEAESDLSDINWDEPGNGETDDPVQPDAPTEKPDNFLNTDGSFESDSSRAETMLQTIDDPVAMHIKGVLVSLFYFSGLFASIFFGSRYRVYRVLSPEIIIILYALWPIFPPVYALTRIVKKQTSETPRAAGKNKINGN